MRKLIFWGLFFAFFLSQSSRGMNDENDPKKREHSEYSDEFPPDSINMSLSDSRENLSINYDALIFFSSIMSTLESNSSIPEEDMLMLVMFSIIFDSKDMAPDYLIIDNEAKISSKELKEYNEQSDGKAQIIFDTLVKAALLIKNNNITDRNDFIIDISMAFEKESPEPYRTIYELVESAAKMALELIPFL
jgi:hypothetical protein